MISKSLVAMGTTPSIENGHAQTASEDVISESRSRYTAMLLCPPRLAKSRTLSTLQKASLIKHFSGGDSVVIGFVSVIPQVFEPVLLDPT